MTRGDILIGIDSGTSVVKAVAFDLGGRQLAAASIPNRFASGADGSATQSLARTWDDCTTALRGLGEKLEHLFTDIDATRGIGDSCRDHVRFRQEAERPPLRCLRAGSSSSLASPEALDASCS